MQVELKESIRDASALITFLKKLENRTKKTKPWSRGDIFTVYICPSVVGWSSHASHSNVIIFHYVALSEHDQMKRTPENHRYAVFAIRFKTILLSLQIAYVCRTREDETQKYRVFPLNLHGVLWSGCLGIYINCACLERSKPYFFAPDNKTRGGLEKVSAFLPNDTS